VAAPTTKNIISVQHLTAIVEPVTRWFKELMRMEDESMRIRGETALHKALDRFAQVIQVAFVTHCVYGNIRKYSLLLLLYISCIFMIISMG
jgi:hypothetical protein